MSTIVEMYRVQIRMLEQVEAELNETHREFVASQSERMSIETEANLKETVIRGMKNIEHSITCQSSDCAIQGCYEMKTITEHMRKCKNKDKSCGICKTVQFYLYEHANGCNVEGCKVVMCLNIRRKLAARKEAAVTAATTSGAAAAANSSETDPSTSTGSKTVSSSEGAVATEAIKMETSGQEVVVKLLAEIYVESREGDEFDPVRIVAKEARHAFKCENSTCERDHCIKMNRMMKHTRECTQIPTSKCAICRQIIAICFFHSRECKDEGGCTDVTNCQYFLKNFPVKAVKGTETATKPSFEQKCDSLRTAAKAASHAFQCTDANCTREYCAKLKRARAHYFVCTERTSGKCSVCKGFVVVCVNHAKICPTGCDVVPNCHFLRKKFLDANAARAAAAAAAESHRDTPSGSSTA